MKRHFKDAGMGFLGDMAFGAFDKIRDEIERRVKTEVEKIARRMDLVTRAEFEAVEAIAIAARAQAEDLEAQLNGKKRSAKTKTAKKPPARKTTKARR